VGTDRQEAHSANKPSSAPPGSFLDAARAQQERKDGTDEKHHEKDFRDSRGSRRDTAKTKQRGDQRNDKKDDGIVQHENSFCFADMKIPTATIRENGSGVEATPTSIAVGLR
jgi:hypothetical protein